MKKILLSLAIVMVVTTSFGQLLTENFSYTAGQLITANGWTAHSMGVNPITVTAPGLTYTGHPGSGIGNAVTMAANGEDDNSAFTAVTSGTVYLSFLVNISTVQAGDYFAGLYQSSSIFPVRIYAKTDGSGGFNLGVSKGVSTAVYETNSRTFGTTYLVVASYTYNSGSTTDDVINLWVNPVLGAPEPAATIANVTGTSADATTIGAVYLRQGSAANASTQQVDAILVGTTWADVTPTGGATPSLSATALADFGSACTGTSAGPNSFTITGSNLTTANVTVAALPGFTYSTTSGGTYTTTLSLPSAGGAFSQEVFVKFEPTLVQSYNGNIAVGGGGATSIDVAAAGSGVASSAPVLTTGGATLITSSSATLAGTITGTGCSSITAYGIEYSTTAGFPNGSGTAVASTNLAGGNFSSDLTSLAASTTYYYHAYATNSTGTGYGPEQSFTTSSSGGVTGLVISQVYGGGGNAGAPFNADYVELHNITGASISLAGLSVQYASAASTTTWTGVVELPAVSIPAGGYYLIQMSATGATGAALPTPDVIASPAIAMAAASGRVALVNGITALVNCPTTNVIDLVGFGASVCFETAATPVLSNTTAALRNNNGCTDTDNNGSDFTVGAPAPRNSATPANICGVTPPTLSASTLTSFGNICVNTAAGPNSFTITGSNLTTANVTVAALPGFTYSTTSGGTYTTTLSLPSAGGAFSQEVFVKFEPTLVQSYNGNIVVGGGGAASIDVTAAGSGGATSAPVLTTGGATLITSSSATLAGTITGTGCSSITAYGIEYSTTAGFPNGSGTAVASTNLAGGNFSSDLIGLAASTTYYYHAYATNGTGTGYGPEQSFTTSGTGPTTGVVISQVYGGGGNASATYNQDFVELFNKTAAPVDISGWSVQYASAAGTTWSVTTIPAATTLAAGQYYLVALATGANGVALPVTPDVTNTTMNLSGTSGKIALVNNAIALSGATACSGSTVVDAFGFGTGSCFETAVFPTTGIDNTESMFRKLGGCTDTDNNSADFEILAVVPRNSASPVNICGVASPTLSASGLTSFGNICINTTAGPNSFTITGSNLTNADVTVAALPGFTYSTTSGGTYTTTLTLPSAGGAFSQEVFVRFEPTLVQSYNGNIVVGGGGASSINVAATGAGVNSLPTVVSGAASAITQNSATVAGTIPSIGCSALTANYGVEYSTTPGFAHGTGTPVLSTNLAAGAFTADLTGLAPATTYYYHTFATNAGGTAYGAEGSFTTVNPNPFITTTALTAFGNVCINTTAGPNSFTINGANLTNADITVGALAGFTYSTTSGGTYTATLNLPQPGGVYSQQIFVRFTPTAVQSYNGNIPVAGGGIAATVNVAASGAGINTAASVTTGAASAITQTTATTAGSIPNIGCSAVTAYGIEYSTTPGFPNGSGIQVASSNLSGGNFTSALTGLTASTTYYYKAYATNAGGTTYGTQQSFTTAAPTLAVTALTDFGAVCVNSTAGPNSFTITGVALTNATVEIGALAGFTYSTTAGGTFTPTLSLNQPGGNYSQQIFVRFTPTAVQSYNGNIPVTGGGSLGTTNVAVSGSGVNTQAAVVTGSVLNANNHSATLGGTISNTGCSNITAYGIEFSTINGFLNGNGTQAPSNNLAGGNFSSVLTGLVQGATYYYKAYATNAGGTVYGIQESFTVPAIGEGFHLYPSPVVRGGDIRITKDNVTPGYYGLLLFDAMGRLVFQKDMNIQSNFINQAITIPAALQHGIYQAYLVNFKERLGVITIMIE